MHVMPHRSHATVLIAFLGAHCACGAAGNAPSATVPPPAHATTTVDTAPSDSAWHGCASRPSTVLACESLLYGHVEHGPMATFATEGTSPSAMKLCCETVAKDWGDGACA